MLEAVQIAALIMVCLAAALLCRVLWKYLKAMNARYGYEMATYGLLMWLELERGMISRGAAGWEPENFEVRGDAIFIMYRRELP